MGTTNYAPKEVLAVYSSVDGADGAVTLTRNLLVFDVSVTCTNTSANGTITINNVAAAITDAIVCATDTNVTRAGTINDANNAVASGNLINIVRAGDAVANTKGQITLWCISN